MMWESYDTLDDGYDACDFCRRDPCRCDYATEDDEDFDLSIDDGGLRADVQPKPAAPQSESVPPREERG